MEDLFAKLAWRKDNGILRKKELCRRCEEFMDRHHIDEKDFCISNDAVDVNGSITISQDDLIDNRLPFLFGRVTGNFDCSGLGLTSLLRCPREVGGNFNCSNNKLKSLDKGPQIVGGDYMCLNNEFALEGVPQKVGGKFEYKLK